MSFFVLSRSLCSCTSGTTIGSAPERVHPLKYRAECVCLGRRGAGFGGAGRLHACTRRGARQVRATLRGFWRARSSGWARRALHPADTSWASNSLSPTPWAWRDRRPGAPSRRETLGASNKTAPTKKHMRAPPFSPLLLTRPARRPPAQHRVHGDAQGNGYQGEEEGVHGVFLVVCGVVWCGVKGRAKQRVRLGVQSGFRVPATAGSLPALSRASCTPPRPPSTWPPGGCAARSSLVP